MWWPANFLAVSRVQLLVNRESESFWREAKMMIPNGLTRDDPSSMPQSLPLVSKPISNHHKMDIVCIPVSYWSDIILPIGWKLDWYLVGHTSVNYWPDISLVSRPILYPHLVHKHAYPKDIVEWYSFAIGIKLGQYCHRSFPFNKMTKFVRVHVSSFYWSRTTRQILFTCVKVANF